MRFGIVVVKKNNQCRMKRIYTALRTNYFWFFQRFWVVERQTGWDYGCMKNGWKRLHLKFRAISTFAGYFSHYPKIVLSEFKRKSSRKNECCEKQHRVKHICYSNWQVVNPIQPKSDIKLLQNWWNRVKWFLISCKYHFTFQSIGFAENVVIFDFRFTING